MVNEKIIHPHTQLITCSNHSVPSSPPSDVMATVVSPTSIMVTWDMVPLIDQNGVITMYDVLYIPPEIHRRHGTLVIHTVTVDGMTKNVVLEDLEEFINYIILVRGYTSAGEGPYSNGVVELTYEDGKII